MKKLFTKMMMVVMSMIIIAPAIALSTPAQALDEDALWGGQKDEVESNIGLTDTDPRTIVSKIINILMGFLGIIAVVLILMGGFKWMTAGGNEEKVTEAKKLIGYGAIGLVIILSAYGIASFVIKSALTAVS